MLTPEAIAELRKATELQALQEGLDENLIDAVAVPSGFSIQDLESYRDNRRRLTGTMKTPDVNSFHKYVAKFSSSKDAMVFVEPEEMAACCALNFGSRDEPGHADHKALLVLEKTAEYQALLKLVANGRSSQRAAAEWCEDYIHCCEFLDGDQVTTILRHTAIRAMRNLKVEAKATATSGAGSFNREKSLLESTSVDTSQGLPHFIRFTCTPYSDLESRAFLLRVGVGEDGNDKAVFSIQIIRHDIEVQQMAAELANKLSEEMSDVHVFMGAWSKKS